MLETTVLIDAQIEPSFGIEPMELDVVRVAFSLIDCPEVPAGVRFILSRVSATGSRAVVRCGVTVEVDGKHNRAQIRYRGALDGATVVELEADASKLRHLLV